MKQFSRKDVLNNVIGVSTISEVARRMGLCRGKIDGRTIKTIRAIVPEIDELLKSSKAKGSSTVCDGKTFEKLSSNVPDVSDNPYRQGSVYELIYHEGSQRFQTKKELIAKAAAITGKSPKCIGYSLEVLCRKSHSSNLGRSTALRDDVAGTIKLISLSKPIH
jgi:hypothetical protein